MRSGAAEGRSRRLPTRRRFAALAAGLPLSLATAAPGITGWQLKFIAVRGLLDVRVNGSTGELITWAGKGGGSHTWKTSDGPGLESINRWVGGRNARTITLWARIVADPADAAGEHHCEMETLYSGKVHKQWRFTDRETAEITRE